MAERIIMGIDPGTQVTGYGLIACQGKQMRLLACGSIHLGKQEVSHPQKLKKIFQRISSLVEAYSPTEMALEAPFYGKNAQSMLKLGRAQGVAMAAGMEQGMAIFEYAPRKIKSAITGNGSASKEQVARVLKTMLKFEEDPKYLDATDGLAVAVCHFFQNNPKAPGKKHKDWASFISQNPNRVKGDK
ncbi:MAG: crossover junction endodeoxyribonuclease RuvC [Bacteroidia bacterium]|nr:crossover junction endodeoxyribonuclease RuvC [Bacteroidia bacterium]